MIPMQWIIDAIFVACLFAGLGMFLWGTGL
jgi:hypothetical protein